MSCVGEKGDNGLQNLVGANGRQLMVIKAQPASIGGPCGPSPQFKLQREAPTAAKYIAAAASPPLEADGGRGGERLASFGCWFKFLHREKFFE